MKEKIEIQDNIRENELIRLFKLTKTNQNRIGIDAKLKLKNKLYNFEIKSTTTNRITTASPLTLDHINKWRNVHWIVGIYNENAKLDFCYYGSPNDMKDWLDYWENDIKRGLFISDMLVDRIDYDMIDNIFGKKDYYSYNEAKFVFKNLYSKKEYELLMEKPNYFNKNTMLEMFKQHNKTYLYRGSNINNPKIENKYFKNWTIIEKDYEKSLRKIILKPK